MYLDIKNNILTQGRDPFWGLYAWAVVFVALSTLSAVNRLKKDQNNYSC